MFKIKIHATGSKGNAYSIIDGDSRIMIDPGLRFKDLQKAIDFKLSTYDFVLLSHEHNDHARSIPDILKRGIPCYMSRGTRNAMEIGSSMAKILKPKKAEIIGNWRILAFLVEHDTIEPIGFLIESPSHKKICYATDTCYIKYRFKGVTHWMIEANYSKKLIKTNGIIPESIKERIAATHFEIENVKKFFASQDLSKTEEIYLIHLSEDNSQEDYFRQEIVNITNKNVIVG
jgi:phosphoribosyl 1,2-cyclic phosphodiesterase